MEVRLVGIDKSFRGVEALRGVDIHLRGGEVHGLIGPNGAGKSTLIKILTGAIRPDAGRLLLEDRPVVFHSPAQAERAGITVVHQDSQLFPDLAVADNVTISRTPARGIWPLRVRDRRRARARAFELLERLGVEFDVRAPAGEASPADRKFVEVARALASDVRVFLLDEPTAALEPIEVRRLFDLLGRLRDQGMAILFVTHKLDELPRMAQRVTALRDGAVVGDGEMDRLSLQDLVHMVAGADLPAREAAEAELGEPTLTARGVTTPGVGPIDLELRQGEVVSLTGLVGSGARSFVRAVGGASPFRAGEVRVRGRRLRPGDRGGAARWGVGYVPEDRKLDGIVPELSVEMNIVLGSLRRVSSPWWMSRRGIRELAERYMDLLDIRPRVPTMPAGNLSGGNQQKVLLAKWLASDSCVLVMEEPTHGIDVSGKAEIHGLLRRFAADGGSVLLVSVEVAEVIGLSNRIGVFRQGHLVDTLPGGTSEREVMALAVGLQVAEA